MAAIVCEYCDSVYARAALPERAVARCERCDAVLYRWRGARVETMLALAIAAAVAFAVATSRPILTMQLGGVARPSSLFGAIGTTYDRGLFALATVVLTTLVVCPALQIGLLLAVLLPLSRRRQPRYFSLAMRTLRVLRPWTMIEVFMLAVFVAMMKLTALATVRSDVGLAGVAALTALLAALSTFDLRDLWDRADEVAA